MKRKHNKILLTLISIFLLTIPANADALIFLNGNSGSGNITILASILVPIPLINLTITDSEETDLFGIAQLTISGSDDNNKLNTLKISMGSEDSLELPVPYGSFGLNYLMLPNSLPPLGVDQSAIYSYLSVTYATVTANIKSNLDLTISLERDQLIELLTIFVPGIELDEFIGAGPFDLDFLLEGEISGTATMTNPTISGEIDYTLTLPEELLTIEIPFIEIPDEYAGSLSVMASFNWDNWNFFLPFATVNLSAALTNDGEEIPLGPIMFDLLPNGTFILWLDREN